MTAAENRESFTGVDPDNIQIKMEGTGSVAQTDGDALRHNIVEMCL